LVFLTIRSCLLSVVKFPWWTSIFAVLASCQVMRPYAPEPQPATVESVEVEVRRFHGRPEAYAVVRGRLSSRAAQLTAPRQSRDEDGNPRIEVMEQTPRGASLLPDASEPPPFQSRIPVELLGLGPGAYTLSANGVETIDVRVFDKADFELGGAEFDCNSGVGSIDGFTARFRTALSAYHLGAADVFRMIRNDDCAREPLESHGDTTSRRDAS